jgi:photosystem II stability/assembly factor-like uncharacterized protein
MKHWMEQIMRKRLYLFAQLTFLLLMANLANTRIYAATGTWRSCSGLAGGTIYAMAIDPKNPAVVYAGTQFGGAFRSSNGGASWSAINTGLSALSIYSLAIDPQIPSTLYAGSYDGIYKTTDSGNNWRQVNDNAQEVFFPLAIDPQNPAILYVGTREHGVYKSTDGGDNWKESNNGLTRRDVVAFAINPASPATLYTGTNAGIYKSTDGGDSWNFSGSELTSSVVRSFAIDVRNPETVFAAIYLRGIYRSTDAGQSWMLINNGLDNPDIGGLVIDPQNPSTVYAGTYNTGIYVSTNSGDSWTALDTGFFLPDFSWLAMNPIDPKVLYAWGEDVALKSTDAGKTWSSLDNGLDRNFVPALAVDPQDPSILYAGGEYAFYRSTNAGINWSEVKKEYFYTIVAFAFSAQNSAQLFAASVNGVYRSTDRGDTWNFIAVGPADLDTKALALDPANAEIIYVGAEDGVHKSTDGGDNWYLAGSGLAPTDVQALAVDLMSPETVYAGTSAGGMYKSRNGGAAWNTSNKGINDTNIQTIAVDPQNTSILYAGTASSGIVKSTDSGETWNSINAGVTNPDILCIAIDPQNPANLYVGTRGGGVFESTNSGRTWNPLNAGLGNLGITALAFSPLLPRTLFAGTFAGVWTYLSDVASRDVPAGGAATVVTGGAGSQPQSGYATLAVDSGKTPYATAVIRLKQNGVTVTEAGVPASSPTASARVFIDYRSDVNGIPGRDDSGTVSINTGIALVNYGPFAANVAYSLRNLAGRILSVGHGTMAAGSHFACFIDQLKDTAAPDFTLPPDFQNSNQFLGTLEIGSDRPLSVLALRGAANQRNEFLVTTTPIADLTQAPGTGPVYFPQFADGGGYTTSLMLLNTLGRTENGTLQILDGSGNPMEVRQEGGSRNSSFRYTIPPGGAFIFRTDGSPSDLGTGWVRLVPDLFNSIPVASGVLSYNPGSILISESGIPAVTGTQHARVYVDLTGGHNTGLAIANLATTGAGISINAFQTDGITAAGISKGPILLPAYGYNAAFADQLITELPDGFTGILDITSPTPFAALTLRGLVNERDDFLMTTFPVADAGQEPSSPIVFPQITDGGGYATQFILISGSGAASTTIHFCDETGAPNYFGE